MMPQRAAEPKPNIAWKSYKADEPRGSYCAESDGDEILKLPRVVQVMGTFHDHYRAPDVRQDIVKTPQPWSAEDEM